MLSRRNVRAKVMQTLYAREQDRDKTVGRLEKSMLENINNATRAYFYNLYLICKTAEYVNTDVEIRSGKFIPSEEDKILSVSLFHNPIIQHLVVTEDLYKEISREKLDLKIDSDYFRQFFQKLKKTAEYAEYAKRENPLLTDDREIISFLYKQILLPDELFQQHVEDVFPTWNDDRETVYHAVMNYLTAIAPNQSPYLVRQIRDQKVIKQFAADLLNRAIIHESEVEIVIVPFLENWDKERVALLDMLLMKMAITEFLLFPEIPVKVTINEYIDLSKTYSTPKSSEFINGILDSVLKKLTDDGKIEKTGRGLQ